MVNIPIHYSYHQYFSRVRITKRKASEKNFNILILFLEGEKNENIKKYLKISGLTLIELLAVIVILGIIAAIAVQVLVELLIKQRRC